MNLDWYGNYDNQMKPRTKSAMCLYVCLTLKVADVFFCKWIIRFAWWFELIAKYNSFVCMQHDFIHSGFAYTGWPRINGTVDTVDFSGLCSNQQLLFSRCWIEHIFPIIITSRSSNLVENFLFYETFIMNCHFRDLPDFQSFEARWQINGKSQKWQSIRNYS